MNWWARSFFSASFAALFVLVLLRATRPHVVVGTVEGFWINAAWAFTFSSGFAAWKGLLDAFASGRYTIALLGRAIIVITTLYICGITDAILNLQFFSFSGLNPIAIAFFAVVGVVISISWWIIIPPHTVVGVRCGLCSCHLSEKDFSMNKKRKTPNSVFEADAVRRRTVSCCSCGRAAQQNVGHYRCPCF